MKTTSRGRDFKANSRRTWCLPPAILREPNETLEYALVLDEHGDDIGLLLWQALRDVSLWAGVEPDKRECLFKESAASERLRAIEESGLDVRVASSLTTLTAVIASPAAAAADLVGIVCMDLSAWAEDRNALATAVAFAQAAALAEPMAPRPAARVGHLTMKWARLDRAETWLRRAVGLARRTKDWECYGYSWVSLAHIYAARGRHRTAKQYATQAARVARRNGLLNLRGSAMHVLLRIAMTLGEYEDAKRFAHAAMRAFGRGHPRLMDLTFDVAYLLVLTGEYERAASHLRKLLVGAANTAGRRAHILAVLARAAAGVATTADRPVADAAKETYRQAWSEAWGHLTGPDRERNAALSSPVLLELARAAATLRDLPRLEQAGRLDRELSPARRGAAESAESAALQVMVRESSGSWGDKTLTRSTGRQSPASGRRGA